MGTYWCSLSFLTIFLNHNSGLVHKQFLGFGRNQAASTNWYQKSCRRVSGFRNVTLGLGSAYASYLELFKFRPILAALGRCLYPPRRSNSLNNAHYQGSGKLLDLGTYLGNLTGCSVPQDFAEMNNCRTKVAENMIGRGPNLI